MWKSFKRKNEPKKTNDGQNGSDDEEDEIKYSTVKCTLKKVLRPAYRDIITQSITEKSLMSTNICALASLLFLYKVECAYDNGNLEFFEQNGEIVIKECFEGVLQQNINNNTKMAPEFRQFVENMDQRYVFQWPNNKSFGNGLKDLVKPYVTSVIANLKTHSKQRLVNYLKLKVFENNTQPNVIFKYFPEDISNVIDLIIFGKDIEIGNNNDFKRLRRDGLLQILRRIHYRWGADDHSILKCNKLNWFKSIPIWIEMQREIDEYNINHPQSQQPQGAGARKKKRRRWRREKQMLDNANDPPEIHNLVVIPQCDFKRTHYTLDNYTLYCLLRQLRLIPGEGGAQIKFKPFMENKDNLWNQFFYMPRIRWFVRRKKEFDFRILSDGISVSLQFVSPKSESGPIDLDKIRDDFKQKKFGKMLGIDPGENKWNSTVQHDVETGKEVSFYLLFNLNHIQIQ